MMTTEASSYLASVKWADEGHCLREFAEKERLPQVGKIIKGQHLSLGVPSISCPSLNQVVFWANGGKKVQVAAQCVRFKEGRGSGSGPWSKAVPFGPKLTIPDDYCGWFEILSEEGRAVRCIESVGELSKRFPETCLVRDSVKANLGKQDDPEAVTDKTRSVQVGETLALVASDVSSPSKLGRFLKCRTVRGETLFLNMDQKGKFSPIAKEDNISGVHSIKNLLSKRFPIMVRLVYGKSPLGFKSFHSQIRLQSIFEEDTLLAMPLLKDTETLVSIPITASLKIVTPKNADTLMSLKEYAALSEKCNNMMLESAEKIQVIDVQNPNKDLKSNWKQNLTEDGVHLQGHQHDHKRRFQSNSVLVKRCLSDSQQKQSKRDRNKDVCVFVSDLYEKGQDKGRVKGPVDMPKDHSAVMSDCDSESRFYEEIDQIYDYVRGFAPLPERVKSELANHRMVNDENRPEPPSVDTIPSVQRRLSYPTIVHDIGSKKTGTGGHRELLYEKVGTHLLSHPLPHSHPHTQAPHPGHHPLARIPMRSNSTGKMYLPTSATHEHLFPPVQLQLKPKLFIKSSSGQRNLSKANRLLKYAKNQSPNPLQDPQTIPFNANKAKELGNNQTCRSCRSLTTSPLFNIRYKSLTNLHLIPSMSPPPPHLSQPHVHANPPPPAPAQVLAAGDFNNTLDSSNSGHQTSSASAGSKDPFKDPKPKTRKLSRPKSLTNLFWDMAAAVNLDKLHNEINTRKSNLINNRSPFSAPPPPLNVTVSFDKLSAAIDKIQEHHHHSSHHQASLTSRKVGTLYL